MTDELPVPGECAGVPSSRQRGSYVCLDASAVAELTDSPRTSVER